MSITITFYSYLKELAGAAQVKGQLPEGSTIAELLDQVCRRFPKVGEMKRSILVAVGVEYQGLEYVLKEGDEVALFPPVQGG